MSTGRRVGRARGASIAVAVLYAVGVPVAPAMASATGTATPSPTAPSPTASSPTASTSTALSSSTPTTRPTRSLSTAPTTPRATTPTATDGPPAPPDVEPTRTDENPLTPAEVRAQLVQAAARAAQLRANAAGLQAATAQLQELGRQMATALDRLASARQGELATQHELAANTQQLSILRADLGTSHEQMGRWARETYSQGGALAAYEGWLVALEGDSTADVARNLAALEHLGVTGGATVRRLERSVTAQSQRRHRAALAVAQAKAARVRTGAAVAALRPLQQRAALAAARLRVQQARLIGSDRLSAQQRTNLAHAEAIVSAAGAGDANRSDCPGLDTSGFGNGAIARLALCPVWGAPGHLLRADAAAALSALSREYAADVGQPLCVTDSYRTLAAQIRLKAAKPQLAARPGTSNHGWGTATDLCGGVESFATAQHAWMLAHAPLRGWFHPAWAEPDGSKPEPWHWEFTG